MQTDLQRIVVALCVLLVGCASDPIARRAPRASFALPDLCLSAQAITSGTKVKPVVVMHSDYDAFVKSKPVVRPLELEQYIWYADAAKLQPKMVSCKMKTADHIQAEYGPNSAGTEASCAAVNQRIHASVLASMSREARSGLRYSQGRDLRFDTDFVTNLGPQWLAAYSMIYADAQGALHIKSKGMQNDWLDQRYIDAPVKFRGTRYCHLIAPEYLRGVLTGAIPPDAAP
jgi:hypothetical protein